MTIFCEGGGRRSLVTWENTTTTSSTGTMPQSTMLFQSQSAKALHVLVCLLLLLLPKIAVTGFHCPSVPTRASLLRLAAHKKKPRSKQATIGTYHHQRQGNYKVWRERATSPHYMDYMNASLGGRQRETPKDNLIIKWIYHVLAPMQCDAK